MTFADGPLYKLFHSQIFVRAPFPEHFLQIGSFFTVLVELEPGHEVALDVRETGKKLGIGLREFLFGLEFSQNRRTVGQMGGYFSSALTILLSRWEIEPKGFVLVDGVKTLVGFHGFVVDKILILGDVDIEQLVSENGIFVVNLSLGFAPFSFLINELIIDSEGSVAVDFPFFLQNGVGLFLINGVEHLDMVDFLAFHLYHSVHIVLIGVVIYVLHLIGYLERV